MTINKWLKNTLISVSTLSLIACGGGGGGSSDSGLPAVSNPTSFPPSSEKLLSAAADSTELFVEEGFTFNHLKQTLMLIQINDENVASMPFARLNIYLPERDTITSNEILWTDEMASNAQLIAGGQTNANGEFLRVIEFPAVSEEKPVLMIEVNAIGIENKTLVTVNTDRTLVTLGL